MDKNKAAYYFIPLLTLLGLIVAGVLHFGGRENLADRILMVTLIVGTLPLIYRMLKDIFSGHFGVDLIAIIAIITSFILGEYLAGTVIVLMLSGGEALEAYALRRASRELTRLLSNAPSIAHIKDGQNITDVAAAKVKVGDLIIIKPGEVVPVDGLVTNGRSEVDESALTGESLPVEKTVSNQVLSGSINKDSVLEVKALRAASESKYEQIISLIKAAQESRARVVRLADRYSVWFTGITFIFAALAWFISHDPIRLLAVLVVATPCPLILATPIAIISGISKAASRGIIVKNGEALEKLAEVKAFIFDKTGTLTLGTPEVTQVKGLNNISTDEVLRLAASLDQFSAHILARSLVDHGKKNKKVHLSLPENFQEFFGDGVSGKLNGQIYYFGKLSFLKNKDVAIPAEMEEEHIKLQAEGKIAVYLGDDQKLLGAVYFADITRPEIKKLFSDIKRQGVSQLVMLTGDKKEVALNIAKQLGLDDIHAEALPGDKVREVKDHQRQFGSVAMIGDGVNDAPALTAADVGIAMGFHGSTASSDTSDIVITVNNLGRVGEALKIAKQVLSIAKQGIFFGMGVSIILMVIAALGHITPVYGALLQELLDVAVILNALRVNFQK